MKIKYIIASVTALAFCGELFAQGNECDAFTLSEPELGGTARSMSMAGAFGALGGNLSVISANPAGLAIYRSSDASLTLDLSQINTTSKWNGTKSNMSKTAFGVDNFGIELYFPTGSGGILNWNFGINHNRVKNFNRNYRMEAGSGLRSSLADYVATTSSYMQYADGGMGIPENDLTAIVNSNGKYEYDPYADNPNLSGYWLSILGYETGMYGNKNGIDGAYHSAFGTWGGNSKWTPATPQSALLTVKESGYIDEYNFGIGTNISNVVFLGASLTVAEINYMMRSEYEELFAPSGSSSTQKDYLYLQNRLTTEGEGYAFNIGAIVNLEKVRLGIAFNTPKYYSLTDYFDAAGETYVGSDASDPYMNNRTPSDNYSEYNFHTPGRWIFSGAYIMGTTALFSADYEIQNYENMHFSDTDGDDRGFITNDYVSEDYGWSHTVKLGAELKPTLQFSVRAGYVWQSTPMLKQLYNNEVEVLSAGTVPHFSTRSNATQYVTVGLGYRFTPNFYIDLAAICRMNEVNAYAFSNVYYTDAERDISPVRSIPAKLKTNSTRLALTLGYKF